MLYIDPGQFERLQDGVQATGMMRGFRSDNLSYRGCVPGTLQDVGDSNLNVPLEGVDYLWN